MTLRGHIKNGVAVLDEPIVLPEGTAVRIEVERVNGDAWQGKTVEEQAREQGVQPIKNLDKLGGEWPQESSVDEFLALIRRSRA